MSVSEAVPPPTMVSAPRMLAAPLTPTSAERTEKAVSE